MAMRWSWRWSSWQFLAVRVLIYVAIAVTIMSWPRRSRTPAEPETPEGAGAGPRESYPLPIPQGDLFKSLLTVKCWTCVEPPGGGREVRVAAVFDRKVDYIEWEDLTLRGSGADAAVLAHAIPPQGATQPVAGPILLTFRLPAAGAPFESGRIFCGAREAAALTPESRVSAEKFGDASKTMEAQPAPQAPAVK